MKTKKLFVFRAKNQSLLIFMLHLCANKVVSLLSTIQNYLRDFEMVEILSINK